MLLGYDARRYCAWMKLRINLIGRWSCPGSRDRQTRKELSVLLLNERNVKIREALCNDALNCRHT